MARLHKLLGFSLTLALLIGSGFAFAQEDSQALREDIKSLEEQLETMKKRLDAIESAKEHTDQRIETVARQANATDAADTKWHLAGYANAGFTVIDDGSDENSFTAGQFNPMFHFQFRDNILFEAELELTTTSEGETETEIEYSQVDYFVNDNLTLVFGKFLSPIGQFQERLHPSWINKLPNAPAGFGHGGAQPLTEIGFQARGGISAGNGIFTYTVFAGNGPQPGHDGLELEGFGNDNNDDKAFGGRFAFLPNPNLEFGLSLMTAGDIAPDDLDTPGDAGYDLYGADFAFTQGPWDVRGEFLSSEFDGLSTEEEHGKVAFWHKNEEEGEEEAIDIPQTDWQAWYLQVARQFGSWEPVVRYGEFELDARSEDDHAAYLLLSKSPAGPDAPFVGTEKRLTLGLNYLFTPSVIGKIAIEDRGFDDEHLEDEQRLMLQLSYGF